MSRIAKYHYEKFTFPRLLREDVLDDFSGKTTQEIRALIDEMDAEAGGDTVRFHVETDYDTGNESTWGVVMKVYAEHTETDAEVASRIEKLKRNLADDAKRRRAEAKQRVEAEKALLAALKAKYEP